MISIYMQHGIRISHAAAVAPFQIQSRMMRISDRESFYC